MSIGLLDDMRAGVEVHLAPLNVDQYHQMLRDGILDDGDPIELIDGALLYKDRRDQAGGILTHGPRHLRALNKLMAILSQWVVTRSLFLQVQGPIRVSQTSEPEPDCCLIHGTPDDYADRVPTAADVEVVFEIANGSLLSDRRTKYRLYAAAGIPIYVIVNLQDHFVEVYSQASVTESKYEQVSRFQSDESVAIPIEGQEQLRFFGREFL